MTPDDNDGRRGIVSLIRALADGGVTLVRDEVRLARIEISAAVNAIGVGTAFVATGAVLALIGALALITGLVLLIGDQWLPADLYWLAALILLLVTGGIAAWCLKRGTALLSPAGLAPTETMTTLKEDKEWLKQRLTSGGTSN